jgi:hypothetical protein
VRIVNTATGNVYYAVTSGFSTLSIYPGVAGSVKFTVAKGMAVSAATLYVVANGIPSAGQSVTVN